MVVCDGNEVIQGGCRSLTCAKEKFEYSYGSTVYTCNKTENENQKFFARCPKYSVACPENSFVSQDTQYRHSTVVSKQAHTQYFCINYFALWFFFLHIIVARLFFLDYALF